MESIPGTTLLGVRKGTDGLWLEVIAPTASMVLDSTASRYAIGCRVTNTGDSKVFTNIGTVALPVWGGTINACTATADGLTTGLIPAGSRFVIATSAGATNALTLPAISAATIGQSIDIHVGANGYELLTPASSGNTVNTVDTDGTNQLDVAANTLLRCVQISATGWACYQIAATTITVVAPDND